MEHIPGTDIDSIITPRKYPMDEIEGIINNQMNALRERFPLQESSVDDLRERLLDMLDPIPSKRPSIDEIFQQPPFDVCMKERKYLMPKMLESRRLGKAVGRQLSEHMGEKPIVVPEFSPPTAPPKKKRPDYPFQTHPPTLPPTPIIKQSSLSSDPHKQKRKRSSSASTHKQKRSSSASTHKQKRKRSSSASTHKQKRKRSSSTSAHKQKRS
jgi:hypothetical protein